MSIDYNTSSRITEQRTYSIIIFIYSGKGAVVGILLLLLSTTTTTCITSLTTIYIY